MTEHLSPPDPLRPRVVSVIGTRPDVIKMAPVIDRLMQHWLEIESLVVATGQHDQMLEQALSAMRVAPDVELHLMTPGQGVAEFASRCLRSLSECFARLKPAVVLVQGDTTTAAMAALAAFYEGALVGHVEAGLRTHDKREPFPEEMNRRLVAGVADFHFAPTDRARDNLLGEGVPAGSIFVTGNTVVDALHAHPLDGPLHDPVLEALTTTGRRVLLASAHRRENLGGRLYCICVALKELAQRFPDVQIIMSVHMNPSVRAVAYQELRDTDRIHLVAPLPHGDLLRLMQRSYLILTDSGGIQEEAPSFGKPVLIFRDRTERPEAVDMGAATLVGTQTERIVREASRLLQDAEAYRAMSRPRHNPFGDGGAAQRIVDVLLHSLSRAGGVVGEPTHAGARDLAAPV